MLKKIDGHHLIPRLFRPSLTRWRLMFRMWILRLIRIPASVERLNFISSSALIRSDTIWMESPLSTEQRQE